MDDCGNGWIPAGTKPTRRDSITDDENRPEYMQFLCTIQIGNFQRQVRQLYFDEEKGWMHGPGDYNDYVVAWQRLPEPLEEDTMPIPEKVGPKGPIAEATRKLEALWKEAEQHCSLAAAGYDEGYYAGESNAYSVAMEILSGVSQ